MAHSHDADEAISKQGLSTEFWTCSVCHDASLKIDGTVAKRCVVFIRLLYEAQPDTRCFRADAGNESRTEVLYEAIASSQRKRLNELSKVELRDRAQNCFSVLNELSDPLAELERPRRVDKTTS
jgi:hypothetical protein